MKCVKTSIKNGIITIFINRAKKSNALDTETIKQLDKLFTKVSKNKRIKAIILTGAGKCFSSGEDLKEVMKFDEEKAANYSKLGQDMTAKLEKMKKPKIAAIIGAALGAGNELIMACDLRIAAQEAAFGQPEIKYGILPGFGATQRLQRIVGVVDTEDMIYTGKIIDAKDAYKLGLVDKIIPKSVLIEEAKKYINKDFRIVSRSRNNKKQSDNLPRTYLDERMEFAKCFRTEKPRKLIEKFLKEKR